MARIRYQITRFGEGFDGRRYRSLSGVMLRLRRHLRRIHGPYTINDGDVEFSRPDVLEEVRRRFEAHPNVERKMVVRGSHYDERSWAVRSVDTEPPKARWVAWLEQYVGRSGYQLGATGPPGLSDCSGATRAAVSHTGGPDLPHSAALQRLDDHVRQFHDAGELENGDLVFLNYGRLAWPNADHVEFWERGPTRTERLLGRRGRTLGSRPSTGGVNYYNLTSYDLGRVISYGRLR